MPNDKELLPFYDGVSKFVEESIKNFDLNISSNKDKAIVDPIVGYVHLYSWEMALLDTNLFQRLRWIRQLSLAYLVFPTLGYSRFEHTLGVLGRLAQVLNKLKDNQKWTNLNVSDKVFNAIRDYEKQIRLAALFHDAGHCLFSHVGERVISKLNGTKDGYPKSETIKIAFQNHFGKPIQFAEIFSLTMLGTEPLHEFLLKLEIPGRTEPLLKKWLEQTARFIVGLPIDRQPETVFLAQLISSGLDVDKIDYMTREAHFSGIKLEIDIDRIFDRLRVFEIQSIGLPRGLQNLKKQFDNNVSFLVLGLAKGGQFSFEEFCISRVSLYEKIYLHQKVRAAESQLSDCLRKIPKKYPDFEQAHRWLYLSDSIINHTKDEVPTLVGLGELFDRNRNDLSELGFENIALRNLYVRAYSFGSVNCLSDPTHGNDLDAAKVEELLSIKLLKNLEAESEIIRLKEEIQLEKEKIESILGRVITKEKIVVDLPRSSSVQQGHETIYFEKAEDLPLRWTMPIDNDLSPEN